MKRLTFFILCLELIFSKVALAELRQEKDLPGKETALSSDEKLWKFSSSVTYETGDFGADTTTNTVYIPFTIKRYFKEGDLSFTIPYIYQESGPEVSSLDGKPFQIHSSPAGSKRISEGIGDMSLKGSYYLLDESDKPLNLSAVGKIKLPTADEDKGLGTGKADETLGLEASKTIDEWILSADIYYTFIGDPEGADLNNEFAFDFGGEYHIIEPTTVGLFYEESTALLDDASNPRDLLFTVGHKLDENVQLFGDVSVGLSNGSSAVGVTAGGSLYF